MKKSYQISESEWLILRCLWKQSPLEIKDILSMLRQETGWNANMVRTLVVRLQEKGAVGAERGPRCYRYSPLADETQCVQAETESFLDRVFEGSPARMIAALSGSGRLSEKDRKEIETLLRSMKGSE